MHGVEGNPSSPQRSPSEKLFRRLESFRFDTYNSGSKLARGGCSGRGTRATSVRNKMHGVERSPSSPQRSPSEKLFRRLGGCSGWGSRTTSVRNKMGKPSSPQGTRTRIFFAASKPFAFRTLRLWRKIRKRGPGKCCCTMSREVALGCRGASRGGRWKPLFSPEDPER